MSRLYFPLLLSFVILLGWNGSACAQTVLPIPNVPGVCGVNGLIVNMAGGSGGAGNTVGAYSDGGAGGLGGIVACTLNVYSPVIVTSVTYYVGMRGQDGTDVYSGLAGALGGTGYGSGGNAGSFSGATGVYCVTYHESGTDVSGGGGGGSSAVINTTTALPLLVAGGGGGGGALSFSVTGGNAGASGSAGGGDDSDLGGAGGTPGAGGAGGLGDGAAYNGSPGESVAPGNGGDGGVGDTGSQSGGGGGAGYGAGGGGGSGDNISAALNTITAGGGGGSNYVCPGCLTTALTDTTYSDTGNGYATVEIYPNVATTTGVLLCSGATSTFTETTPGGTWSSSDNDIAMVSATTGSSIIVTAGGTVGTANISYTEPSGYWSFVTVTVYQGAAPITGPDSLCVGQSINLLDSIGGGTWTSDNPSIATVSPSLGVLTGISTGSDVITYTLLSGCNATYTVTVDPFPSPIQGTMAVCTGDTTVFTNAVTGGTWTSIEPSIGAIDSVTGALSGLSPGNVFITYGFDGVCIVTAGVAVNPTPPAPVISSSKPLCLAQTLLLQGTDDMNGGVYSWTGPNGFTSTVQNPDVIGVTYADTGAYTVVYTMDNPLVNCPSVPVAEDIAIQGPPILTNVTPSQAIPYGSSIQLNADNAFDFRWIPDNGSLSNTNINDPMATPLVTTTYTVFGMNQYGCVDSALITITVDSVKPPLIPTAFTPNGDGLNDVFRPLSTKYQQIVEFRVYNRWGQQVFYSDNAIQGWDGTFNGVRQDMGDYFYQVIVAPPAGNGENIVYKGIVTLIR